MAEFQKDLQHFILTRFNILLWQKDKEGDKVRTSKWLEHRFSLFENYCLPSIKNQTYQDFEWIVLFDSMTPEIYKTRILEFQSICPQLIPVFISPQEGRHFAKIFREEVIKRLKARRVVTTYLDNDDALDIRFVEDLRRRALTVNDGTFIRYNYGYQFYTDNNYMMQIHYPRNHFVSVVENGNPCTMKGIYGYGGHYHINEIEGAVIENISNQPMWCEIIHERNMINDAYFLLKTKMVRDRDGLRRAFAIDETVRYGMGIYLFDFLPRYIKTFFRRAKHFLFRRQW